MRRCHNNGASLVQIGKNGCGKCRPLYRVSSCPEFIKERQTVFICFFQNRYRVHHMGGKGAEVLFNTLFISYIGINFIKDSQAGAVKCRNVEPCLPHQGKKPYCL